jgi:hypothetical protein
LEESVNRASLLSQDNVQVKAMDGRLYVEGKCMEGKHTEDKEIKYDGPDLDFLVPPKLISEVISKHSTVEVTDSSIRVNGGKFIFCACLGAK